MEAISGGHIPGARVVFNLEVFWRGTCAAGDAVDVVSGEEMAEQDGKVKDKVKGAKSNINGTRPLNVDIQDVHSLVD